MKTPEETEADIEDIKFQKSAFFFFKLMFTILGCILVVITFRACDHAEKIPNIKVECPNCGEHFRVEIPKKYLEEQHDTGFASGMVLGMGMGMK